MGYSFGSPARGRLLFSLSLISVLHGLSLANGYLQASAGIGALIGGPTGGYDHINSNAFAADSAFGTDTVTDTKGGYYPGFADQFGQTTATSTAKFGHLTESSSATSRGYTAYTSAGYGGNAAYASEVITIHGSGTIALTLHTLLIGNTLVSSTNNVVDGAGTRVRSQINISPSGYTDHSQETGESYDYDTGNVFDTLLTSTINVTDGSTLRITGAIEESNGVQLLNGAFDPQAARTVTAVNEANLHYWITLSPGASLSSESGYLYEAPAAVPEPASLAALGLGAVALLRRRKRA